MNGNQKVKLGQLEAQMQNLSQEVVALAKTHQGESLALLSLLRTLEQLHRNIQNDFFQASLPNNRHELYKLLKDIEETGGWPYIERMRLRSLLANLEVTAAEEQRSGK